MAIDPEADIGDHLLAGVFASLFSGAAHVGQGNDVGKRDQARIDLRFAGIDIESRAADVAGLVVGGVIGAALEYRLDGDATGLQRRLQTVTATVRMAASGG